MSELHIIDAGAKFGIHPSNLEFLDSAHHFLIDADADEIRYLEHHYKSRPNVYCSNYCLTSNDEYHNNPNMELNLLNHPGGNTLLTPDENLYYWKELRPGSGNIRGSQSIKTITIDHFCQESNIRPTFFKLDIEGYEVKALEGSVNVLKDSVLCLRVEVELNSLYKDHAPSFGKVCEFLRAFDFQFMNFDFMKNSFVPYSPYFKSELYGQLVGCDAIFVKSFNSVVQSSSPHEILNYALFCLCNNLEDLAIRVLLDSTKFSNLKQQIGDHKSDFSRNRMKLLERKVAKLFFGLRDQPKYCLEEFSEPWKQIFGEDWISHGDYFRKYPLS